MQQGDSHQPSWLDQMVDIRSQFHPCSQANSPGYNFTSPNLGAKINFRGKFENSRIGPTVRVGGPQLRQPKGCRRRGIICRQVIKVTDGSVLITCRQMVSGGVPKNHLSTGEQSVSAAGGGGVSWGGPVQTVRTKPEPRTPKPYPTRNPMKLTRRLHARRLAQD